MSTKSTQAEFLEGAKTLIENAASIPEIVAILAGYGYDAARFGEGKRLWAEADELSKRQALEYGGQHESGQELGEAWESANRAYMKSLKLARLAFANDAKASTALRLLGPRAQSSSGWLEQASTFYANLRVDPSLAAKLSRYGYTAAKLEAEAGMVEAFRDRARAKAEGTGAAQASTVARDRKLRELDSWVTELRTICRVAFYESPQELEKLGVLALNGPKRAKRPAEVRLASASSGA